MDLHKTKIPRFLEAFWIVPDYTGLVNGGGGGTVDLGFLPGLDYLFISIEMPGALAGY